jgi:replicative DNA helicase|nr:MAG TPA: DnaB-like replicative helicase [Caudoviricetes sp.]
MNEAEYTFLSELVAFPENFTRLKGNFKAEFLPDATAREIFSAMVELGSFDLLSLRDSLKGKVNFQLLLELNRDTKFSKPIMFDCYALKLVEDWKERELAKIAGQKLYTTEDVTKAFEIEHFELFPKSEENASDKFLADAELEYQGKDNPRVVKTGLPSLDKLIGGFEKGELITLGGYSGGGKTTLALNIATQIAQAGGKVLYFSLEMTKVEMHKRLVCSSLRISDFSKITQEEFYTVVEKSKSLENDLPLEFIDDADTTVEKISAICAGKKDLSLIIIDHLHILRSEKRFKDQLALLTYLSRKVKIIAQDLNIPILLLSQLNRSNAGRDVKSPILSDLRGSGSIEQDSNLVMFVYTAENLLMLQKPEETEEKKYNKWLEEMERVKGKAKIIVAKNRRGRTGEFEVLFKKSKSLFIDNGGNDGQF